ncbi:hypothetical protein BX600DRAFT_442807 [Xylariales sp. PMI_506]|nr:hypothetical protein BX600DRAFT_442807 [Xylariales sp. PMI_506]
MSETLPNPHRAATGAVVTAVAAAIATSSSTTTTIIAAQPETNLLELRQVLLTQTITYASTTFTTVVTLGRGDPTSETVAAPTLTTIAPTPVVVVTPSTDGGLTSLQLGIILGCVLGAALLIAVVLCCLLTARRRAAQQSSGSSDSSGYYDYGTGSSSMSEVSSFEGRHPRRGPGGGGGGGIRQYWRSWRSVPPPVVPVYSARDPGPRYTANVRVPRGTYVRGFGRM